MSTVNFDPANINCGVIPRGGSIIDSTSCGVLSAPANVTASISDDTSGGALTLLSVKSFITETELEVPDPGELPPGTKPPSPPVKIQVPVQQEQSDESNRFKPLAVATGQYVEVNIQFAPTVSTPDKSTAILLIQGNSWNPASIPIPIVAFVEPSKGLDYTIVLMLWGPPQPPSQTKWLSTLTGPDLSSALTEIAGAGYFTSLAQYKVKQVIIAGSPTPLTKPPWPPGDSKFTTLFTVKDDITKVIKTSFSSGVPSPDKFSNTIPVYIVITPRGGEATDHPRTLGYHSTLRWGPANTKVLFAYVGAQSNLNDTIAVATHEIVEAIGDNGGAPKELCDGCKALYGQGVTAGIETFSVASYFDAATNQCVAPPSFYKPAT